MNAAHPPEQRGASLRDTLADETESRSWRYAFRPMLLLQFGLYVAAIIRFWGNAGYDHVGGAGDASLHENHIGNLAIMAEQPNRWLLLIHLGMATYWVGGVLVQKHLLSRMAGAIDARRVGAPRDPAAYKRYRRAHAILGSSMCLVAFAGCVAGPLIAWFSHGHAPMRTFLLLLPIYFLPAICLTWWTARRKRFRDHQAWADLAFLGPAVASLWAEGLIFVAGRHTALGPRLGELVGVSIAWIVASLLLVLPVWLRRRRAMAHAR